MKAYRKFYNELNEQQRLAVDTTGGPVLVLAGPGTGKTQLLSVRAGAIIDEKKAGPENILILTYTNPAAKAMKERLAKVIGPRGYDVEVGTFHSFANSIIQESEEAANYAGDKILMSDVECASAIEHILNNGKGLDEIRPFRAPYTYMRDILKRISELKKDGVTPARLGAYLNNEKSEYRYLEDKYIKRLRAFAIVYKMYEGLKEGKDKAVFDERGRYDFDDMILFATDALRKEAALRKEYQKRYGYVMVDEYQDTNGAQLDLLFTLLDYDNPNIACVGDDDQSIYRFQGAGVGNFKLLKKRFPALKTISLKNNYRSTCDLIDISSKLINLIPAEERECEKPLLGMKKYAEREIAFREFTTIEEELCFIVDKVRSLKEAIENDKSLSAEERMHPYNNIAILVRKRDDILKIIDALLRAGIPYATDGKEDISGEMRVRQLLDVLDLANVDPNDQASKDLLFYRVLSSDYLRIPHSDTLRFVNYVNRLKADEKEEVSLLDEFLDYFKKEKKLIKFAGPQDLHKAALTITHLLDDAKTRSVHTSLLDFIKEAGIFRFILKEYTKKDVLKIRQLRSLGSFVNMIKASDLAKPAIRLDDFLAEMKTRKAHGLSIQGSLVTLTQSGVRVYTAHGSKGLEFHSVIIPFCLQNKNWPARALPDKIRLPSDLFKGRENAREKELEKQLVLQDETRLFYVAMTRAKANLIFTASPTEAAVPSFYISHLGIQTDSPENIAEEELIEKSLETTDLQDPFTGTEDILKDMIYNMSLNPTRLNNYLVCRRKFLYNDVLKLPGAKKKSLVFGNCAHKALELTYKRLADTGKFPAFEFFKDAFKNELKFQGVDKVMRQDCLNKLETLAGWFDIASGEAIVPIGLERKLVVTVGENIIFTGKYDKVEWDDKAKGLVRIIDYKTGKPDDHLKNINIDCDLASPDCDGYLRQLVAYKLLFERDKKEAKGRKVGSGALVFLEPVSMDIRRQGYRKGDYATKKVDISDDMVASLEGVIKNTWRNVNELKFEKLKARDTRVCGNCDFDTICWGGE